MSTDLIQEIQLYQSTQSQWEKYASVRSKPRRLLNDEESAGYYFPPDHQPLCIHPLIEMKGEEIKEKILIHSLYKYLNDIANIEKDIINHVSYKITKNSYFVDFSRDMRHDALSIIIDESYHAYVALDFLKQVEEKTSICSLELPNETPLSHAIKNIKSALPDETQEHFEFIATCIAEHALTNDLIAVAKSKNVSRLFYHVMHDHANDEGRHARYFSTMLKVFWGLLADDQKKLIGPYIPVLINRYFDPIFQRQYEEKVLNSLGFSNDDVQKILDDTHGAWSDQFINEQNVIAKQMIGLLKRTGVFDTICVKESFAKFKTY